MTWVRSFRVPRHHGEDGLQCSPRTHRILSTYPTGTVRISPGYFNTEEEIQAIIEAIAKIPIPEYSTKAPELHYEDC